MREIIKEQLKQVQVADLNNFDTTTNTYHIPKYIKPNYDIGSCYIIKVSKQLLNNATSVWATNWNNGSFPKNEYLKIYVSKVLGKMLFVDSVAFDINTEQDLFDVWTGWVPTTEITQIKVV